MSTMCRFLTAAGYLGVPNAAAGPVKPAQVAVEQWCSWMRDERGLTEKTIAARCHFAAGVLDVITAADGSLQWDRLDASVVNGYVAERGRPYGVVTRAHVVDAGRIHRIGQRHMCHMWSLMAQDTREGSVYARLLQKLEQQREALQGRVYDVLGTVFEGDSLRDLMICAIREGPPRCRPNCSR